MSRRIGGFPRVAWSGAAALFFVARLAASAAAEGPGGDREPDPLFLHAVDRARAEAHARRGGPRLAVLLVVDMMRSDDLPKLLPWFPEGGFRRMWKEGAVYRSCRIPYSVTVTGPGHATLATGAGPSTHGIVGNAWYEEEARARVGCVEDSAARTVGSDATGPGISASPHRLRAATLGDVLRSETLGHARIVSIAGKDRSAVLLGGYHPGGAYWIENETALLVTSDYYTTELPSWADSVRAETRHRLQATEPWRPVLEPAAYLTTVEAEGRRPFPAPDSLDDMDRRAGSPFELETIFRAARRAVEGEGLGTDGVPDLLAIGVSTPDYVGHEFGPESPEYMDLCARLDREVASLLEFLDRRVGRGAYTVAVSADHGVASLDEITRHFEGAPADTIGGWPARRVTDWANEVLDGLAPRGFQRGSRSWVLDVSRALLTLDERLLEEAGVGLDRAASALVDAAWNHPRLAGAYSPHDPRPTRLGEGMVSRARRNGFPGRSGHVVLVPRPYVSLGTGGRSAQHGSPYEYDVRVPLLFWGYGVRSGQHWESVETTDLAPTLAALLGIRPPASCEGRVLAGALGESRDAEARAAR